MFVFSHKLLNISFYKFDIKLLYIPMLNIHLTYVREKNKQQYHY